MGLNKEDLYPLVDKVKEKFIEYKNDDDSFCRHYENEEDYIKQVGDLADDFKKFIEKDIEVEELIEGLIGNAFKDTLKAQLIKAIKNKTTN